MTLSQTVSWSWWLAAGVIRSWWLLHLHSTSHRDVLVYWSDCTLSPSCKAVLFYSTAKRYSRTQKQWIQTWNECSCERIKVWHGKRFYYICKSFSKSVAGCLGVSMWCFNFFLTWFKKKKKKRADAVLSLPSYSPITPPAKTLTRARRVCAFSQKAKIKLSVGDSKNKQPI